MPDAERAAALCPCEGVAAETVERAVAAGHTDLGDLRRRARIGLGACQGTACAVRAADLLAGHASAAALTDDLADFGAERRKGMAYVAWGGQARQLLMAGHVRARVLGLGAVPAPP